MALKTDAYFREVAAAAIDRIGCYEPPIPVEAIVASLGVPIRPVNLPAFFSGAVISEDGLPVIALNWAKSEAERREALAHMLGHILLVIDNAENRYPREDPDHRDADLVARELITPTQMVVDQAKLWFNDYRYLARLFAVDETRMLDRMRDLGLIKGPQGVMWDF